MRQRKTVLLSVAALLCACVAARDAHAQSKSELVDLIKAYRAQVTDMDVRSTHIHEILADDPAESERRPITKVEEHIKQRGLLHFRESVSLDYRFDEKKPQHTLCAYDGETMLFCDVNNKCGQIARAKERMRVDNWIYAFLSWPQQPTSSPFSDLTLLITSDRTTIDPERKMLYGVETTVLHYGDTVTVWLDVKHGGIIRKMESRQSGHGALLRCSEVPELHEIDGVYLPARLVRTAFVSEKSPGELWNTPTRRFTITIPKETFKINCGLTREDFQIEFPPGTRVYDAIMDIEYTVGDATTEANQEH